MQLAFVGCVSVALYWLCFICLAYRVNAHYLLFTILHKYLHTQQVKAGSEQRTALLTAAGRPAAAERRADCPLRLPCLPSYEQTDRGFHVDVLLWLAAIAVVNGALLRSSAAEAALASSVLPLCFSAYLLARNAWELLQAVPVLGAVHKARTKEKLRLAAQAAQPAE